MHSFTHTIFIDDLVQDINLAQLGVNCQTCTLSTLLYADDIVLSREFTGSYQCSCRMVYEMGYECEPGQDQYSTFLKKVKTQA